MEALKTSRAKKAGKVTRKVNELSSSVAYGSNKQDVMENIATVKVVMEELGTAHDEVVQRIDVNNEDELETQREWYEHYVKTSNKEIKAARDYIESQTLSTKMEGVVRLKKLEIPTFKSEPTKFHKWRRTFERLTNQFDYDLKYDYLLNCTEGEAHRYVENRNDYVLAMDKLVEKYGNIHTIINLLIEDIRSLNVVKSGDFRSFENLNIKVNEFYDKLTMMGRDRDVENSYILKEIESKFNRIDLQKWLESLGDNVDDRTVNDLVTWLDKQTHIRRIIFTSLTPDKGSGKSRDKYGYNSMNITIDEKCTVCDGVHQLRDCEEFAKLKTTERWNHVKRRRACFNCLKDGHRRVDCKEEPCDSCSGAHNKLLHQFTTGREPPYTQKVSTALTDGAGMLPRCFLPATLVVACNQQREVTCTAALDTLSEVNIISSRCYRLLNLKGEKITLDIIGAGGTTTTVRTKVVELGVKDKDGNVTVIECIVLNRACGRMLPVNMNIFNEEEEILLKERNVFINGGDVDLLIGMTRPELHRHLSYKEMRNGLALIETKLGHCLVGSINNISEGNYESGSCNVTYLSILRENSDVCNLHEHLQSELAGIRDEPNLNEMDEEEVQFAKTMKLSRENGDGRFKVNLPWKINPDVMENNRSQAIKGILT